MATNQIDDIWNNVSDIEDPAPKRCGLTVIHYWDRRYQRRISIKELPAPVIKALYAAIALVDLQESTVLQVFWNPSRVEVKQSLTPFITNSLVDDYAFTIEYTPDSGLKVDRRCLNPKLAPDFVKNTKS